MEDLCENDVLETIQNRNITAQQYISNLPKEVKRRIRALKRLQVESNEIEAKFFLELHQLERKYQSEFEPIFTKRAKIITAEIEPTDEECNFPVDSSDPLSEEFVSLTIADIPKIEAIRPDTDDGKVEEKEKENKNESSISDNSKIVEKEKPISDDSKIVEKEKPNFFGIPDFWLTIMKNVDMLREMVQPHDEEILKHLIDIRSVVLDDVGFKLEFLFSKNLFFSNEVLTKTYFFKFSPDMDSLGEAITYDGPEIIKCKGTTIDWYTNKNVTVRHIQKLQKHKGRGVKRVVMKTIQMDSFFNFFNPPQVADREEVDEDVEEILQSDYEIGQFLRERIIPRAVLYFTGEACEDDDDDDEDDEYDEYEDGDDEGGSECNDEAEEEIEECDN